MRRALRSSLLLALAACGGAQQQIKIEPSSPTRPAWISKLPDKAGFAFVVGAATRTKTLEDGKARANQSATVQISNIVGTQIRSEAESRSSTDAPEYAKEQVEAQTAAFVKSLQLVDEYSEKTTKMVGSYYEESYDTWVLGRFPLNAADEERKRQAAEQAEMTRDALKRFEDASGENNSGHRREAWILLAQAKKTLAKVPPLTEVHSGGFDTAADLVRAIDKVNRGLDELARSLRLDTQGGDEGGKSAASGLKASLAKGFGKRGLNLRTSGDARFVITVELTSEFPAQMVMGQKVAHLTYTANVRDSWSGADLAGSNGDAKGFGKGRDAAIAEAVGEVAKKVADEVAKSLLATLARELEST